MGRRRKCRRVAMMPAVTVFKPQGVAMTGLRGVVLSLDGFEALRLVDAEGLSQEEAAVSMDVSRPTLCRILGEARTLVARALTAGWAIRIETEPVSGAAECVMFDKPCRTGQGPRCGRKLRMQGDES